MAKPRAKKGDYAIWDKYFGNQDTDYDNEVDDGNCGGNPELSEWLQFAQKKKLDLNIAYPIWLEMGGD